MNNHSHETGWEWYLSEHLQGYRYIDHSIFDTTRIKMGNIWHVPEYIPTCLSWSTGFDQNTVEAHTQYALMTFTKLVRAHLWGYRLNPTTHNVATHLAQFQELPLLPGGNVMKDFLGQDSWATEQQQRSQILKRYVDVSLRTGPPGISFGPKKTEKVSSFMFLAIYPTQRDKFSPKLWGTLTLSTDRSAAPCRFVQWSTASVA